MLKITKDLKPTDVIISHTDSWGDVYVRVRVDGEDFCIAARDYMEDGEKVFTWDDAMELTKQEDMKLPTKEQISILKNRLGDINDVIEEIGGNKLISHWEEIGGNKLIPGWYWTKSECDDDHAWCYNNSGDTGKNYKSDHLRVRMVLNL